MRAQYQTLVALVTLATTWSFSLTGITAEVTRYSIEDFLDTTHYRGLSFSPDKKEILVSSNETGIFNAFSISISDGKQQQLTESNSDSIFTSGGYFPNDERFIYSSDQSGNEFNHVYVRELDGSVRDLTPGKGFKAKFFGWSHDDKSFFLGTTERDKRYFDAYEYDFTSFRRRMIYQNSDGYDFQRITSDKRQLALSKIVSNDDADIYLFDLQTKNRTLITKDAEPVKNQVQAFSPDGKYLYYTTNNKHEFKYLVRYELASARIEEVLKLNWDIAFAYFSKQGKYLVVSVNNDGRTELTVYEAASMNKVEVPELSGVSITSVAISRDETMMGFYASSSRMPSDLFMYDFSGKEPKQLTRSLSSKIDANDLVEGQVMRFASYDQLQVPGIYYKPQQADADHPVPALIWIHGGPGGQSRIGYNPLTQYLVNHGFAIYAINNRGSSGYGKTFFHLDDRKHGEADLEDVVAAKKMLADLDHIDGRRIGIMGRSYGGYLTLAALTFRPDVFAVGVDLFGISNWYRTVQSIPPWWESYRVYLEKEMGDFGDEDFFRAKSPLFHAKNIKKPLMVLQGANDPRVLKAESDDIVAAVKKNGVPVVYVVFDDEGHGFVKKANQIRGYKAILEFLDKHLRSKMSLSESAAMLQSGKKTILRGALHFKSRLIAPTA